MNTEALITMFLAIGTVTGVTGYFFYLVLKAPHKQPPPCLLENDLEQESTVK